MPVTDPISDMFVRIKNAARVHAPAVEMPASKQKIALAELLRNEGFISSFETKALGSPTQKMRIVLKYGPKGEQVIQGIRRISKPGLKVYRGAKRIPKVFDGLGISIISTSSGLVSNRDAKKNNIGGEVIAHVW